MTLSEKMKYVYQHVRSVLRHDDEPLAEREVMAKRIVELVKAELDLARGRETPERLAEREQSMKEAAARQVLEEAKAARGRKKQ